MKCQYFKISLITDVGYTKHAAFINIANLDIE
jgi:hypothetical protein